MHTSYRAFLSVMDVSHESRQVSLYIVYLIIVSYMVHIEVLQSNLAPWFLDKYLINLIFCAEFAVINVQRCGVDTIVKVIPGEDTLW